MSKKPTFDLKLSASSLKDVHRKYELTDDQSSITKIETIEEGIESLTFLDETRKAHKCFLSKIDFNGSENYRCFWDQHNLHPDNEILACPTKYVPSVVHRSYFSEINKEQFVVKESMIDKVKDKPFSADLSYENNDYYESDGIFCSEECMMAFAIENKKKSLYANSELLINRIARRKVTPAPHWRMLKVYGGTLDIKEFREYQKNIQYVNLGIYKPFFRSIAHIFEQKIRLN